MERLNIIKNHLSFTEEICIVGYIRSAIQPAFGEFRDISLIDLAGQTIQGLLAKYSIDKSKIEEFYMGCAYPSSLGQAPAKQIAVNADLPDSISCMTINKLCGSGMKAFMLGCLALKCKSAECVLVGGAESMSNYPFLLEIRNGMQKKVKNSLYWDVFPDAVTKELPIKIADDLSKKLKFSKEDLDNYAIQSCNRAMKAYKENKLKNEIFSITHPKTKKSIPVDCLKSGENIRNLKPLLKNGVVTAGNTCGINDGASFIILTTRSKAIKENWRVIGTVVSFADAEQASENFPISPALAIQKSLKIAGLGIEKVDFMEINEPFAVAVLGNAKLVGFPVDKINVYGGALSLGHPVGSSGCKIIGTLMNVLEQEKGKYGIASICNGGGGASAVIIRKEASC